MSGQASSLHLFRRLAREAVKFPVKPVGRKVLVNVRELFQLYRDEKDPAVLATLHEDGAAALRVLDWLKSLAQVPSNALSCAVSALLSFPKQESSAVLCSVVFKHQSV